MRIFLMKMATIFSALAVLLLADGLISGTLPLFFGLLMLAVCLAATPCFFKASLCRPKARRHPRGTPPAGSSLYLRTTSPVRNTPRGGSHAA